MSETEHEAVSTEDLRRMLSERERAVAERERQLAEQNERVSRLERERDELASHAGTANEQRFTSEMQMVETYLASAQREAEEARAAWASAMESGDYQAASKAQWHGNEVASRLNEARNRKQWLETNREKITAPPPRREVDPYDAVVKGLMPTERSWLQERPKFLSDEKYRNLVFAASQMADNEGNTRGSEAYFRRIEELLGETKANGKDEEGPGESHTRMVSSDAAPARRSAPGAAPSASAREVRLTPQQREVADDMFGNPLNTDGYVADPAERYQKYWTLFNRLKETGRL